MNYVPLADLPFFLRHGVAQLFQQIAGSADDFQILIFTSLLQRGESREAERPQLGAGRLPVPKFRAAQILDGRLNSLGGFRGNSRGKVDPVNVGDFNQEPAVGREEFQTLVLQL